MARLWIVIALLLTALISERAAAGGTEFPADGARNLGRGGAGMARADDPYVMVRNPALLADLLDNQALLGAHLLLADSCFRPSGGFGAGVTSADAIRLGGEILVQRVAPGSTRLDGTPLVGYELEPYAPVCYEGPAPFLPHVALTMKPADDLGVGIGFFPPDSSTLGQWGNRDGSYDTPNGLRPNPLRYLRAHSNHAYFSVLGAVGYRAADWLRFGIGFQWQLVVFESRTFSPSVAGLTPSLDVQVDVFGRDLFIPAFVSSIHLKPFDALDIALGFKWSDNIDGKAKLDITTGAFGTGEPFEYIDGRTMMPAALGSSVPTTTHNFGAEVETGPIWVPQVSAGLRYASRLTPDKTQDAMATERWDIELDGIYYFTSSLDYTRATLEDAQIRLITIDAQGHKSPPFAPSVGDCIEPARQLLAGESCKKLQGSTRVNGQDQITARLGGDYNVLPSVLALRAGVSYETDGQTPAWRTPMQYMAGRIGLHSGFTVRIAKKTDITFAFAHFIQEETRLQINPQRAGDYRAFQAEQVRLNQPDRFHIATGRGIPDVMGNGAGAPGPFDGTAAVEIPNGMQKTPGPYFANAGSYYYNLSMLSLSISQRF